jgi:hypothetical protein
MQLGSRKKWQNFYPNIKQRGEKGESSRSGKRHSLFPGWLLGQKHAGSFLKWRAQPSFLFYFINISGVARDKSGEK